MDSATGILKASTEPACKEESVQEGIEWYVGLSKVGAKYDLVLFARLKLTDGIKKQGIVLSCEIEDDAHCSLLLETNKKTLKRVKHYKASEFAEKYLSLDKKNETIFTFGWIPDKELTPSNICLGITKVLQALSSKPSSSVYLEAMKELNNKLAQDTLLKGKSIEGTVTATAVSEEDKAKQMEAMNKLTKYADKYPLGLSFTRPIHIDKLFRSTSSICISRRFDMKHAEDIIDSMMDNPGQVPMPADVVPYDMIQKKPLKWTNVDDFFKQEHVKFMIIDGQHSVEAQRFIVNNAKRNGSKLFVELYSRRNCRFLSGSTSPADLAEISAQLNEMGKTFQYKR